MDLRLTIDRRPVVLLIGRRFLLGSLLILRAEIFGFVRHVFRRVGIGLDELHRRLHRLFRLRREVDVEGLRRLFFPPVKRGAVIVLQQHRHDEEQQDVEQQCRHHADLHRTHLGILREPGNAGQAAARAFRRCG